MCSFYDWYCDLPPGEPLTWGVQTEACECADWFNSKYIVLWGSNISQTRIPDAHFAYEARYNGAKIVCISPDFNSSCIHADLYCRIQPGTDAALALGVAKYFDRQQSYRSAVHQGANRPASARALERAPSAFSVNPICTKGGKDDVFFLLGLHEQQRVAATPGSMGSATKTIR